MVQVCVDSECDFMSKVRLCTVQDRDSIPYILDGTYKADFNQCYAMDDDTCYMSYLYMLVNLAKKTGKPFRCDETCIWAWYQNPFLEHHDNLRNIKSDLVVITFEVDSKDVLFSDFDLWNDMIIDCRSSNSIVELDEIKEDQCVQAVLWGIPKRSILSIESFSEYVMRNSDSLLVA